MRQPRRSHQQTPRLSVAALSEPKEKTEKEAFEWSIKPNTVGKHSHSHVFVYVCVVSDSSVPEFPIVTERTFQQAL